MFKTFRNQVKQQFAKLSKDYTLYYVNVDRDKIWEAYISGFSDTRQEHTCNACRSFLRNYGGIVAIDAFYSMISIFDGFEPEPEYEQSITNLRSYIHSLPITDIFLSTTESAGTDKSLDLKRDQIWYHLHLDIARKHCIESSLKDTVLNDRRTTQQVFKRALSEFKISDVKVVLELIEQNSLYRGSQYKSSLVSFLIHLKNYKELDVDLQDNFAWYFYKEKCAKIRNTSIGTLLQDLSKGEELDSAIRKYESIVDPSNYQRPTSLASSSMIQKAKQSLQDKGLLESLTRRFATEADLNINDILFTHRSLETKDVFEKLITETVVNPKTFSKVEEVTIETFVTKILPSISKVEILPETTHLSNFVTLLTASNSESPNLFKWSNSFSWSYTGNVTDSFKEKVKEAGGVTDAVLRYSIFWNKNGNDIVDLDAHAKEPSKNHIYYVTFRGKENKSKCSGYLDVDMINPKGLGVENIVWTDLSKMIFGEYQFSINNFNNRRHSGFDVQIEFQNQLFNKHFPGHFILERDVATIILDENGFRFKDQNTFTNTAVSQQEKWGIKTNTWYNVSKIMLSPNFWQQKVGNKHYFFFLDDCICTEKPRPFYNEFLRSDLTDHRKALEMVGGAVEVEKSTGQLSGLGFSETQHSSFYVRITSGFQRILKINV